MVARSGGGSWQRRRHDAVRLRRAGRGGGETGSGPGLITGRGEGWRREGAGGGRGERRRWLGLRLSLARGRDGEGGGALGHLGFGPVGPKKFFK